MQTEIETVKAETLPIPQQAKMIVVRDEGTLRAANDFFNVIRALRKKIASVFDPMEEAAKEAKRKAEDSRKAIVIEREKLEAPLKDAESYLGDQVIDYKREVERKRAEEDEKNRQQALKDEADRRKKEEDRKAQEAAELEAAGLTEEAEAVLAETIEETQKPMEVYIPPPDTPRVKLEGASIRETWSCQCFDLKLLCKAIGEGKAPVAYAEANLTALNAQARSLKKEMSIPGCRAVSTSSMASTGRRAA